LPHAQRVIAREIPVDSCIAAWNASRIPRGMSRELISGVYESLRARCATSGDTIAKHPYCGACGRPRRCDDSDWQTHTDDGLETHCCGTCLRVSNL
jgi:hypothetical protein